MKSRGEELVAKILKSLNISFETQKTFDSCRFPNTNALAKFDFYLPKNNIVIEYNGIQHYEASEVGWNTKESLEKNKYRDSYKISWCKNNGITLIIIPYTDFDKLNENYILSLL